MQEQEVEVSFCDLCGTSVPEGDLGGGRAVRCADKTVGACCLAALRAVSGPELGVDGGATTGQPAAGDASAGAATAADVAGAGADGGRLLTVAIVVLAAIAGGVLFLEGRMARFEDALEARRLDSDEQQRARGQTLQEIALQVDEMPSQQDLQALVARVDGVDAALDAWRKSAMTRDQLIDDEFAAMRREIAAVGGRVIDYTPLLEDLRQRQIRLADATDAVRRAMADARPVAAEAPSSAAAEPVVDAAANDLPEKLAAEVAKLASADPAVRFGAVDMLSESGDERVLQYLAPLVADKDGYVRRLTVEVLAKFRKPEAVDALLTALEDADELVRDTAWQSLCDLTGQKFVFRANDSDTARKRSVERWREWWQRERATFGS